MREERPIARGRVDVDANLEIDDAPVLSGANELAGASMFGAKRSFKFNVMMVHADSASTSGSTWLRSQQRARSP